MKLAFVFIGGQKEDWLTEVTESYRKKLGFFCPTEIIRLKPTKLARASSEHKLADETADLLKILKKDDVVVVCDERGALIDSIAFSKNLVKLFERGRPRVVFVIGGAFGIGPAVQERADWTWSLSPLVFNHHVAQVVALEQVYRAFAIWKNLPYHNA